MHIFCLASLMLVIAMYSLTTKLGSPSYVLENFCECDPCLGLDYLCITEGIELEDLGCPDAP